jgi:transcriptional regulator with XRE-family HTH domain
MTVSGNQLKAARALAGLDQVELAKISGVGVNTIRNMEAAGESPIRAQTESLDAIQGALRDLNVTITNGDRPGAHLTNASRSSAWLELDEAPNTFVVVSREILSAHLNREVDSREDVVKIAQFNSTAFAEMANERRARRDHSPADKRGQIRIVIRPEDLKNRKLFDPKHSGGR